MSTLQDQLDSPNASAWRPTVGAKLIGRVVGLDERDAGYGPYVVLTVRQENGEELAVHCFHSVLASKIASLRPRIGETIGLKYEGKTGDGDRAYHSYVVKLDRPEGGGVDWSKHGESAVDGEPAAAPSASDSDFAPAPPAAGDEESIPF